MIYNGILSRTHLRSRLAEESELEIGFPSQVRSLTYSRMHIMTLC